MTGRRKPVPDTPPAKNALAALDAAVAAHAKFAAAEKDSAASRDEAVLVAHEADVTFDEIAKRAGWGIRTAASKAADRARARREKKN